MLRQAGVLLAVGDTLVVGLSGRLVGLNPAQRQRRAGRRRSPSPRGTNDVERLVDLVGPRQPGRRRGLRAGLPGGVGCVDAARGTVLWTKPANGAEGVAGDDRLVFGTEIDGKVVAWRRDQRRARLEHRRACSTAA